MPEQPGPGDVLTASGDRMARLRHALRTPLNHILGYAELLLEDDEDMPADARTRLDVIQAIARSVLEQVQAALAPNTESPPTLLELNARLRIFVERLGTETAALLGGATPWAETARADLRRIESAIQRLLVLLDGGDDEAKPRASDAVPDLPGPTGDQGHLLVVDDDEDNRNVLTRHLRRQGYHVTTAAGGREALALLPGESFDLLLLDVLMPDMDGIQVLGTIKSAPALAGLPVIMISALDETRSVVRCIEMGAEDYLPKPFDPVLLRARMSATLEKKRLRDAERRRTEELEAALEELRRTQDQLIVQEKLASLGALTAGIAHEIKNPLNFVTNFASLAQDTVQELRTELAAHQEAAGMAEPLLADLEQSVAKVEEHGRRADRIVKAMLMHSRGRTGERELTDLNQMLTESTNLAFHGARAHDSALQATIEMDLDASLGRVAVVSQDLSRVLVNILNNAFYAINERRKREEGHYTPTIRVASGSLGRQVELRIRDNGMGIPPEVRERLFQPFFTTKPAGSGTGLGLSISHDIIVREHRGELLVETEPGRFTEFIIRLPRDAKEPA